MQLNDQDRQEIARLISEGYTSGRIDSQQKNGDPVYINWELTTDKWADEDEDDDRESCPNCLSRETFTDKDDKLHCENCLYVED
jgi:ribosomal protein S27AE